MPTAPKPRGYPKRPKVVSIKYGMDYVPNAPYKPTVEMLEYALERAKRGELKACAMAYVMGDQLGQITIASSWPASYQWALAAAINRLFIEHSYRHMIYRGKEEGQSE